MKTTLNNPKYRQSAINIILNRLATLQDVVKNNSTNITNNYSILQINEKKTESNASLIDNNTNNIKNINLSLTHLKKRYFF